MSAHRGNHADHADSMANHHRAAKRLAMAGQPGWRTTSDGRVRFVGTKPRGASPRHLADDDDLRIALRELAAARADLAAAYELPEVDRNGRLEKRAAIGSALGKAALASRFIDAVVIRRGGTAGDCEVAP